MKQVTVGVVGVGYLGGIHAEKYARIPEANLVGVADIDTERSQEIAAKTNCQYFSDYRDLFGKVEAVSIAVPTHAHYPIAQDFFREGIDILLEKPIATTTQEAQKLNATAREQKAIFQVGHLERFNGALAAMNGFLRDPIFIESYRFSPFLPRAADVDVVRDLMIHDIDIILNIVKSEIKSIEAVGTPLCSSQIDVANARMRFKNGCVANISANRIAQEKVRRMTILQNDAYLKVDYIKQSLMVTSKDKAETQGVRVKKIINKNDPLETELKVFLHSVQERTTPVVTGEDGQRALEVALQIVEIIETTSKR